MVNHANPVASRISIVLLLHFNIIQGEPPNIREPDSSLKMVQPPVRATNLNAKPQVKVTFRGLKWLISRTQC